MDNNFEMLEKLVTVTKLSNQNNMMTVSERQIVYDTIA